MDFLLPVVIIGAPLLVAIFDLMGTQKGTTSFRRDADSRPELAARMAPV